ncbi:NAD(P)/FAD-dependent oxidoreductase [Ahrensia sp. 13_GOM-1096m]|uniref:FAD-dependent monooxygenase n=1 Tax=Ahrensia sp. 13_GOM-1096m TaxID=1380380 RepID=UPI00047A5E11|nr:NAD(P)/FAD-dependent oxidoreductase [Ahrensia sp. 13_GOM-1096m]
MSDRIDPSSRIIIVGAAAAGLSCAAALHKNGFTNVTVVDKASTPNELELAAPINLGANAVRGFDLLGIKDQLESHSWPWKAALIQNRNGKKLAYLDADEINRRSGYRPLTTTRTHMLRTLRSVVPTNWLSYGVEVASVVDREADLLVTYADGREEQADFLVGANGYYSPQRDQVMGKTKARSDGKLSLQALIPAGDSALVGNLSPDNVFTEVVTPKGSIGFGQNSDLDYNIFYNVKKAEVESNLDPEALLAYVTQKFAGIDPRIDQLTQLVKAKDILVYYPKDRPVQTGWSKRRIVLIGDAAHPAFQYTGQGAAMAIESALVLADCLKTDATYSAAFARFEARRLPRLKIVHAESYKGAKVFGLSNPMLCALRDFVMGLVPNAVKTKALMAIHSKDFMS